MLAGALVKMEAVFFVEAFRFFTLRKNRCRSGRLLALIVSWWKGVGAGLWATDYRFVSVLCPRIVNVLGQQRQCWEVHWSETPNRFRTREPDSFHKPEDALPWVTNFQQTS